MFLALSVVSNSQGRHMALAALGDDIIGLVVFEQTFDMH
jgi:hypothetical protein